MASINKLAIRGVRSFSPDDDEQVISFCFPLTIIVGENGCGKTTIIESLKYAVTGSLPPGNKSGHSFIHDPKSVGQSTVKGQIKLRFTNRQGNSMVVIRSMEVTQKKTSMSFKALDGVLRTSHPETGERVSLSHKCTELDRQIPALLGVSKAVLEHVVFCHQEESSWPLMDGATIKKRFDDIFDSARYTKALEQITKTRKDLASGAKDLKADLYSLDSHKHAASLTREELEQNQEKILQVQEDMKSYDEQIQIQTNRIQEIMKSEQKIEEAREHIQRHENLIQEQESVFKSIQNLLEQDFTETHSEGDLQKMLKSFNHKGKQAEQSLIKKQEECNNMKKDIELLTSELIDKKSLKAKLESENEANEETVKQRLKLLHNMSVKYKIQIPMVKADGRSLTHDIDANHLSTATQVSADFIAHGTQATTQSQHAHPIKMLPAEQIESFITKLHEKHVDLNQELEKMRHSHQKEEDKLQSELSTVEGKHQAIKSDLLRIKSQQKKMEQQLHQLNSIGSSHSRIRKSDLDTVREQVKSAAKDFKELSEHPKLQSIPKQLKEHDDKLSTIQHSIDEDNYTLSELRRFAQDQNTINMLKQQVHHDLQRLEEACTENSFTMQKYNVTTDIKDLSSFEATVDKIREKYDNIKRDLDQADLDLHAKQQLVTRQQTLVENSKQNHTTKIAKVARLSTDSAGGVKRISRVLSGVRKFEMSEFGSCPLEHDSSPQNIVKHLESKMKEFQHDDEEIIQRSTRKILKLYQKKLEDEDIAECPCCARLMDPDEAEVFIHKVSRIGEEIVALDHQKLRQNGTIMAQYEKWKGIVNNSAQDWQELTRLKKEVGDVENLIKKEEEELTQYLSQLEEIKSNRSTLQTDCTELQNFYVETGRLQDDALRIADKQNEIKSKEQRIARMAPDSGGRDLQQVETDVNNRLEEKDTIMRSIATLNKEMSSLNKRIQLASTQLSSAEEIVREKEKKYKRDQEDAEKKVSLKESISKLLEEEQKVQENLAPLKRQSNALVHDKERMRAAAKLEETKLTENIKDFSSDMQTISAYSSRINNFMQAKKIEKLDDTVKRLVDLETKIDQKKDDFQTLSTEVESMKSQVGEQERHKKSIQDNLRLIDTQKKVSVLKEEYEALRVEFEEMVESENPGDDYETATAKKDKLSSEKARREGRLGELKGQQRELKKKLQTKEYKDIDERHRVKMIEFETTNIMVSDLETYHQALDKALLQYHGIKIEDINKIIKELWTLTYQGEDIHNIKIVSGQDKGSRASRSYNYRVVMTKGNTEMDMRGRCSAGQRVLASIVIRLALAETFCLHCGVLALDEPTTNLDYENKRGLASALAQIIANRAAQRNFQLVTITHDEEFVNIMKRELSTQTGFSMPEHYFQVSREEGRDGLYYSKISAVSWDDL